MKPEYFDVDKEMAWYKSDTPCNLRTGGKKAELSGYNKVGRGPYKKKERSKSLESSRHSP